MGKCVWAFEERKDIDANIANSIRILLGCSIKILIPAAMPTVIFINLDEN